jgi:uncharacterized pyridoxal phosphate-containing UPF0001 family protein
MVIPAPSADRATQAQAFAQVKARLDWLNQQLGLSEADGLDELSMGMSADLEAAIAQGATWVRIGTDLFGLRDRPHPLRFGESLK